MNVNKKRKGVLACLLSAAVCIPGVAVASNSVALPGSNFEIDDDANFIVDHSSPSIDWVSGVGAGLIVVPDEPTGSDDDSFKGGTKEDTEDPQTTTGSIPNNKSDLKQFGVLQETNAIGDFLHLFWTRVQDPSGTTLMDFELNSGEDGLYPSTSTGAEFPVRRAGDLLIEYKLAQGGVTPELFMYTWLTSEDPGDGLCEASNSFPCWGDQVNLTAAGIAIGSINKSNTDSSTVGIGSFDPYTFGEASIDLSAIFPEGRCQSFGWASLKSRSSDSFSAQMKDFIAPYPVNISNCAKITINKTDDSNPANPLAGAEFTLYYDNGNAAGEWDEFDELVPNVDPKVTDGLGQAEFTEVFAGNYCVVETKAPSGHSIPEDPDNYQCFELKADTDITRGFTNPRIPAIVNILKLDDATPPNVLEGAEFTLFTDTGLVGTYEAGTDMPADILINSCTTGSNGECSIKDILPPGNYCVAETGTPTGYDTADPQCFSLTLAQTVDLEFVDPRQPAKVNILKKDNASPANLLSGAQFTLYNDLGAVGEFDGADTSTGKICTTDVNGECSIDNILPPGNYCLVETVTPTGYDTAPAQCMSLALNETVNLEFVDPRQPAKVNILKKDDADPANLLSGAQFTLYNDLGAVGEFDGADTSTGKICTTDVNGECSIDNILPPGNYCLVETVTPTGYDTAPAQCMSLALSETVNLEFVDSRQPAKVNILKKDDADPANLLSGAQFTLYNDLGAVGEFDGADTSTGKICTTDVNGECSIDNILPPGNYCLVETVTPTGYDTAPAQCMSLVLNETVNLEFVDPRQPAKVIIIKKDDESPANLLSGAEFTLYNDLGLVGKFDGADTSTGKTCTTDGTGVCTIDNILPPGNYCLVETKTPDGHATADPQCENLSLNETVELTFIDPRLRGAILITKTRKHAAEGPGDHPHDGVTFTVSGGGLDEDIVVTTNALGQACVNNMLFSSFGGDYLVTETVPGGYLADDGKTKSVTVTQVSTCGDGKEAKVSFSNTPLTDITITIDSLVLGGTQSEISCTNTGGTATSLNANTDPVSGDGTFKLSNREPGTYTCVVVVDP